PLLELGAAPAGGEHGVVRCGPIRINVREAARHLTGAAHATKGILGGGPDARVERREAIPRDRGLEGLAHHAHRDECVTEIGSVEEGLTPRTGGAFAGARLGPLALAVGGLIAACVVGWRRMCWLA